MNECVPLRLFAVACFVIIWLAIALIIGREIRRKP